MLSKQELKRYNRHIILSEVGQEGQEKLKAAKVLVIGAGGLGCPVLQYLTAAGVGTIGIVDFDKVDESNLQRQILFETADVGKLKAFVAAEKLARQNPHVNLQVHTQKLTSDNALDIFKAYDLVVDGSDNFPTRYLVNDVCVMLDKPLVFGSIFKFEGQVSVFNYTKGEERGPTYRCLFPEPPGADEVPNCSQIGVIGVLPGIIGSIQANEAIKIILEKGDVLAGRLLIADLMSMSFSTLEFAANPENFQIDALIDYEEFCNPTPPETTAGEAGAQPQRSKELSVEELKEKLDGGEDIFILDVREEFEYEICNIGGTLIPMNQIQQNIEKVPTDKEVVVLCHHGMRSAMIVKFLSEEFGYKNLYNLEGGIHSWATEIDPEMETY